MDYAGLIPVNVVTGFLGSGKTTLLQRLLSAPSLRDTAVLVNEFGEVGLDHHLLQNVTESTLLLDNGCVCCAIRGDLQDSLRQLFSQRDRGDVPPFKRVVIETSGLADPVPIAYTVLSEPVLQHHFRLGSVVTTVDAVNGAAQLAHFDESVKQVAVADRIVLTKADLADDETVADLRRAIRRLNGAAPIIDSADMQWTPEQLLVDDIYDTDGKAREVDHWLAAQGEAAPDAHGHTEGVTSFAVTFDRPLDWTAFGIWMTMLLNSHGDKVLRIKGLLNVSGVAEPVLINGVQHIVHPPVHMAGWPDTDKRSRIVFIVRGLDRARIEASMNIFNDMVNPAANADRDRLIRAG